MTNFLDSFIVIIMIILLFVSFRFLWKAILLWEISPILWGNGPSVKTVVIPPGPRLSPQRKQKAQPINKPNMKYVAQPPWFNLDHIWWAPRGKFIYVDHPIARHPHEAKRSALHPKQVPFRGRAYKKIEKNKKNGIEVWRPRNLCEIWNFWKG